MTVAVVAHRHAEGLLEGRLEVVGRVEADVAGDVVDGPVGLPEQRAGAFQAVVAQNLRHAAVLDLPESSLERARADVQFLGDLHGGNGLGRMLAHVLAESGRDRPLCIGLSA